MLLYLALYLCPVVNRSSAAADAKTMPSVQPTKQLQLDLDKAAALDLPDAKNDLTAVTFKLGDRADCWVVRLPGNLGTSDGRLICLNLGDNDADGMPGEATRSITRSSKEWRREMSQRKKNWISSQK